MERTLWQRRVQNAIGMSLRTRTFAAFNTNVDAVVHINNENIAPLLTDEELDRGLIRRRSIGDIEVIKSREDFVVVLMDRLASGKSFHIVVEDEDVLSWWDRCFPEREERMGGQAGIIANQMACLGASSVVYTALLSKRQADMFVDGVLTPKKLNGGYELAPVSEAYRSGDKLKVNWIFEYAKDERFDFWGREITTPRANRIIVATRPKEAVMSFIEDIVGYLPQLGAQIDIAFLAGYHYAARENPDGRTFEEFMNDSVAHLRKLRQQNPDLRMHYEYVPARDRDLEPDILKAILGEVDSFGINENEIKRVLAEFGQDEPLEAIKKQENAYTLYQGALALSRLLGTSRIQVHNLGYYVFVLRKPYPYSLEDVRQAALFASAVNAMKAKYGGYVTSERLQEAKNMSVSAIGFEQLEVFQREAQKEGLSVSASFSAEGLYEADDHYALVVPAHIVQDPVSTVGMGDTISSSCYAAEVSGQSSQA